MPGMVSSPRGTLDLKSIEQLTNTNDINKFLRDALAAERGVEADLEELLGRRSDLESDMLSLTERTGEVMEVVYADAEQLLSSVESTAAVAERISKKVKELDLSQSRMMEVLSDINVIMDRTTCVGRLQKAMQQDDYERAAECIADFKKLEGQLSQGGDPKQKEIVDECETQLEATVRSKFNEAVDQQNHQEVSRFAKLFNPLNKKEEGLRRFVAYLKVMVGARARKGYQDLSDILEGPNAAKASFVETISMLFKDIALAVEENEKVVRSSFGAEAVLEVIMGLQQECDTHGSRIIQRFLEARRLPRIVKEIGLTKQKEMALMGASTSTVDPRSVENYLQELLLLCQRSEEYNQFMLTRMTHLLAPNPLSPVRETTFRGGQLNVSVRELIGYYITLEEYYMEENVKKAIEIDEMVPDSLTTSMVDDVFFILRKCATRAMATSNLQCVCSILGLMNTLLAQNLSSTLQSKLSSGPSKFIASGMPSATATAPESTTDSEYPTFLNNTSLSAMYVVKLKSELEQYVGELFTVTKDRDVVVSVLADFGRASGGIRALANRGLDQVADGLMPRIKRWLDEAASSSYELNENEYSSNELGETWVERLLGETDDIVSWLEPVLTSENHDSILQIMLDRLASRVEALMMRKKFNQLGGLQLDRDVRNLVGHLSETSQRTVRDKFARLNQIATVLCLETVDEILDYWGDEVGAVAWRLTPGEIKSIMRLRIEFADEKIAALVL